MDIYYTKIHIIFAATFMGWKDTPNNKTFIRTNWIKWKPICHFIALGSYKNKEKSGKWVVGAAATLIEMKIERFKWYSRITKFHTVISGVNWNGQINHSLAWGPQCSRNTLCISSLYATTQFIVTAMHRFLIDFDSIVSVVHLTSKKCAAVSVKDQMINLIQSGEMR